jgi:hypothetical protein
MLVFKLIHYSLEALDKYEASVGSKLWLAHFFSLLRKPNYTKSRSEWLSAVSAAA